MVNVTVRRTGQSAITKQVPSATVRQIIADLRAEGVTITKVWIYTQWWSTQTDIYFVKAFLYSTVTDALELSTDTGPEF